MEPLAMLDGFGGGRRATTRMDTADLAAVDVLYVNWYICRTPLPRLYTAGPACLQSSRPGCTSSCSFLLPSQQHPGAVRAAVSRRSCVSPLSSCPAACYVLGFTSQVPTHPSTGSSDRTVWLGTKTLSASPSSQGPSATCLPSSRCHADPRGTRSPCHGLTVAPLPFGASQ